jgi:transposase
VKVVLAGDQVMDRAITVTNTSIGSKATRAWLAAHPRFAVTYTPKHASWLNMVELIFSILTRRLLQRGESTSREHLANKIINFFARYNRTAKPFRWTYDGRRLKAA